MDCIDFDFKNPDYTRVFMQRTERLSRLRADPTALPYLKAYYKDHPAQFVSDWGCTVDAKNVELSLPAVIPFILFPKQAEWVDTVVSHWKTQRPLLTEKTRQMGFSWLSVGLACTLCLFNEGMQIGFGSRKEEYVDKLGDPKSLLEKARIFMKFLPAEFQGGWSIKNHAPHMRIMFPQTDAIITGETGDEIGRGATTSIYFVDESAFLERPLLVESSLSQTTNCRIDISTPNGMANPFAEKRHNGSVDVFTFHWRDDPRKDDAWYAKQKAELPAITVAQEIDIDYAASVEGVVIPGIWIRAAIDAHLKLGIKPTGQRIGALDVADEGKDLNAFCGSHGILIDQMHEWSGKNSDIFYTAEKAFLTCDLGRYEGFKFDSDGLGAGIRGDARILNEQRTAIGTPQLKVDPFRGSEAVFNPLGEDVKGRKNEDFFANRKAQGWWALRTRFQQTYRAVVEGQPFNPDDIISISSMIHFKDKLINELSQPTYEVRMGKILINKAPDGMKSPNLADSVMICFARSKAAPMKISHGAIARAYA